MAITKKDDALTFSVKIPRELHDQIDSIRSLAKGVGATYDPSEAVVRALRKDLSRSFKEIEVIKQANASHRSE